MGKTIKKIFTKKEIVKLVDEYKNGSSTKFLREKYHTSHKKIKQILLENGIDIHNPNCEYLKHKPIGYWNNKEHCEEVAKQCRNRGDFQKKFPAAYLVSKKNGWLEDFDKYFSLEKQYYNYEDRIHVVYAYEIVACNAVYVGRTMQLKTRHNAHKKGVVHTNHKLYSDTVYDFCQSNNVEFPEPKVLESGLTAKESRKQEGEWVKKYEDNGWMILNKAKTGEGSGSLGATRRKWGYEECKDAASQCVSKADFRKKFPTACRVSTQNKWISEFFTSNLLKDKGCFDHFEGCLEECKKYHSIGEVKKKYPFLYHKICKNKWNLDIQKTLGWKIHGIDRKGRIKDTANISDKLVQLVTCKVDIKQLSAFENKVFHHLRQFECGLLNDSVYGLRLNLLINKSFVIGVDTISNNLEWKSNVSHMLFLNETIKYNELGYPMIHVFDSDFTDAESIVWDKIDLFIGNVSNWTKVNARECEVKEIYKYQTVDFLNENHIQGFASGSVYIGAYYNEDLVGVMVLKNGGLSSNSDVELLRFATKNNYIVNGLGSKMFDFYISKYEPYCVISFADRRYLKSIENNLYTKLGFTIETINRPDYRYVDSKAVVPVTYHKMLFNKQKLHKKYGFPLTMTETEMAKELGYDRIWDCGLVKYVWKKGEEI